MENLKIFFQDYTPVSRGGRGQGTGREGDGRYIHSTTFT